jgi:hypothetical protein
VIPVQMSEQRCADKGPSFTSKLMAQIPDSGTKIENEWSVVTDSQRHA